MDLQVEDVSCTTVIRFKTCVTSSRYLQSVYIRISFHLKNAGINVTTYLTDAVQWKNGKPIVMYHLLQCQRQIQ